MARVEEGFTYIRFRGQFRFHMLHPGREGKHAVCGQTGSWGGPVETLTFARLDASGHIICQYCLAAVKAGRLAHDLEARRWGV